VLTFPPELAHPLPGRQLHRTRALWGWFWCCYRWRARPLLAVLHEPPQDSTLRRRHIIFVKKPIAIALPVSLRRSREIVCRASLFFVAATTSDVLCRAVLC
jgi:hypothetical protein